MNTVFLSIFSRYFQGFSSGPCGQPAKQLAKMCVFVAVAINASPDAHSMRLLSALGNAAYRAGAATLNTIGRGIAWGHQHISVPTPGHTRVLLRVNNTDSLGVKDKIDAVFTLKGVVLSVRGQFRLSTGLYSIILRNLQNNLGKEPFWQSMKAGESVDISALISWAQTPQFGIVRAYASSLFGLLEDLRAREPDNENLLDSLRVIRNFRGMLECLVTNAVSDGANESQGDGADVINAPDRGIAGGVSAIVAPEIQADGQEIELAEARNADNAAGEGAVPGSDVAPPDPA
jgi:hypothetical protein